jgi:eukaryotic-like serine/threonine-protein kinase
MINKPDLDTKLIKLAVTEGFLTSEQVDICKRIANAFEDNDPRKSIDIIMMDRGYISLEQWAYLAETLGIKAILCPYCEKRYTEADNESAGVNTCKYCGKQFDYNESHKIHTSKTSPVCDKTLASTNSTQDHYINKTLGGKYKIIEKIATGGWSTIYKAKRTLLNIDDVVAIKILHLNLSDNPQDIKRFYNEASTIRELHHPNAIHLYDFDRDADGTIFMAMEFIHGKNLKEIIKDTGVFDVPSMLNIIFQVCDVISTAHKHPKKIIHRDITLQNIMLTDVGDIDDFVKVLDFGIVKLRTHDNVSLTGSIVGTPLYMAPEQWRGECDERTDIYSLGVVMYEMLAGEPPFKGDQITLMNKHLNDRPKPFRKLNKDLKIPKYIEEIIFKCLEKIEDKRPQSVDELKSLLQKSNITNVKLTNYTKFLVPAVIITITLPLSIYMLFQKEENTNIEQNFQPHIIKQTVNSLSDTKLNEIPQISKNKESQQHDNNTQVLTVEQHKNGESINDTSQKITDNSSKQSNKVVANIQKHDIDKAKKIIFEPDPIQIIKNEIKVWLQNYKTAWEKGDVETLQKIGHITSEKEVNKLINHYSYVHDVKVSIQNEVIEIDNNQVIISFDRTDEWIDERGNKHREDLPKITKVLHKENNTWEILK